MKQLDSLVQVWCAHGWEAAEMEVWCAHGWEAAEIIQISHNLVSYLAVYLSIELLTNTSCKKCCSCSHAGARNRQK